MIGFALDSFWQRGLDCRHGVDEVGDLWCSLPGLPLTQRSKSLQDWLLAGTPDVIEL